MPESQNRAKTTINRFQQFVFQSMIEDKGEDYNSSRSGVCSVSRYYGKTFSRLANPRKRSSGPKKKFHRQRKK